MSLFIFGCWFMLGLILLAAACDLAAQFYIPSKYRIEEREEK